MSNTKILTKKKTSPTPPKDSSSRARAADRLWQFIHYVASQPSAGRAVEISHILTFILFSLKQNVISEYAILMHVL